MQNNQIKDALDLYAESLIKKKGLDSLSDEKREILKDKVKETLVDHINMEILRQLPDDKLKEFEKAVDDDEKTVEDLGKIVESAGLDMEQIVKKVADGFSEIFLKEEM